MMSDHERRVDKSITYRVIGPLGVDKSKICAQSNTSLGVVVNS